MNEGSEKYYTVKEAARECHVSEATIKKHIKKGDIKTSQIPTSKGRYGFQHMISETELFNWLEYRDGKHKGTVLTSNFVGRQYAKMDVTELAGALLNMIQQAYNQGYQNGVKDSKNCMLEKLKEV